MRRLLPRDAREFVVGDLDEEFRRYVVERTPARARRWYRWQAVRTIWRFGSPNARVELPAIPIRDAVRSVLWRPIASITIVATIGIAVAATTTVYSALDGVLLTPLAFGDPDRVVRVSLDTDDSQGVPLTAGDFRDLGSTARSFSSVAALWGTVAMAIGEGRPVEVQALQVTTNYFATLQIEPYLGDFGNPHPDGNVEMGTGLGGDVVISHTLWATYFGSDPTVVGRRVPAGSGTVVVSGVLPPDVDPQTVAGYSNAGPRTRIDMWIPVGPGYFDGGNRSANWVEAIGRLAEGVSVEEARAEMVTFAMVLREASPAYEEAEVRVRLTPALHEVVGQARPTIQTLMGAVVCVLLIACANIANILLAQVLASRGDAAVRSAMGESRWSAFLRTLATTCLLAGAGGALGTAAAWFGVQLLRAAAPPGWPRLETIQIDLRVLTFALLATASTAILAGMLPALREARRDAADVLRDRVNARGSHGVRRSLVGAQVALSLVLLAGAGWLLKGFTTLQGVEPGFQAEGVLTFLYQDSRSYPDGAAVAAGARALGERLELIPNATAVGLTQRMPLRGGDWSGPYATEAMQADSAQASADYRFVSPGYLAAMGTSLLAGRVFDGAESPDMIVIDANLAAAAFPNENAVGKRLWVQPQWGGQGQWSRIVGVVEHMRHATIAREANPTVYYPIFQVPMGPRLYGAVRTTGDLTTMFEHVRDAVAEIDPRGLVAQPIPLPELVADDLAATRFTATLVGAFAAAAVLLAAVGLYGVLALWVQERRFEFGVRRALGASREGVVAIVAREIATMLTVGLVVGAGMTAAAYRFMESLVHGTSSSDPAVLVAAIGALALAAIGGAAIPARRAIQVDPVNVLRG